MKTLKLLLLFLTFINLVFANERENYPADWWKEIPKNEAKGWEILPQDAKSGEVILSKRTELGIFSNLSFSPFVLDGEKYNSVEGLWQGMKYPDKNLKDDIRFNSTDWKYTREEVFSMSGWDSKEAGNLANEIYFKNDFSLINYKDHQFIYTDRKEGSEFHLDLITRAIREKVNQNEKIKELLKKTSGLILRPDHFMKDTVPASFKYHEILMKIRDEI